MPVTATSTCPCGASRSRTDSDTSSAGKLLPHPVDGINRDIEHPHLPEHFRQFFFHELPAPVSLDHFRGVVRHEIAHPAPCIDYSLPGQQVVCTHDGVRVDLHHLGKFPDTRDAPAGTVPSGEDAVAEPVRHLEIYGLVLSEISHCPFCRVPLSGEVCRPLLYWL